MSLVITPVVLPSGKGFALLAGTAAFTREGGLPGDSMVTAVDSAHLPTIRINGGAPIAASRGLPYWSASGAYTPYLALFYTDLIIAPSDVVAASWAAGAWTTQLGAVPAATDVPALNLAGFTLFGDLPDSATMGVGYNLDKVNANAAVHYYENAFCSASGIGGAASITRLDIAAVNVGLNFVTDFHGAAGPTKTVANVPPGDYLLKWDGASNATLGCYGGTVTETGTATITGAADNTRHYTLGADSTHYGPELYCTVVGTGPDGAGQYNYDFHNPRLYRASVTLTDPSQMRPGFLARLSCQSTRFLDPLGSNFGNATDFTDFQSPTTQIVRTFPTRTWEVPISQIEGYSGLAGTTHGMDPSMGVAYLITTSAPHGLSIYQYVAVYGFAGNPLVQLADGSGNTATADLDGFVSFALPITATTFVMYGGQRNGYHMTNVLTPAHCHTHIDVGNGMSVRDMVDICNATGTHYYFNTTPQATQDALEQCAAYAAAHLNPGLKFRVEPFNEVWNFGFPINNLAGAMTYATTAEPGGDPFPWTIELGQQQWGWMKAAWIAGGRDAADFVRVRGSLGANTGITGLIAEICHAKGFTFDEMCVGAYLFNQSLRGAGYPAQEPAMAATLDAIGLDPDPHLDILELNYVTGGWEVYFPSHRDALVGKTSDGTHLYPEFESVKLIVYEGGPDHLAMWGGSYGNSPILNHAVAYHPRWHGIYQGILRIWQDNGCTLYHDFDYADTPRLDGTSWTAHLGTDQEDYQPGDPAQDAIQVATPGRLDLARSVTGGALKAWASRVAGSYVPPSPDFTLSLSGGLSVTAGASAPKAVTLNVFGGYTGTATLSASGLPSGVTGSFSPTTLTGGGTTTSTLTITASGSATAGTSTITITGNDAANSLAHAATLAVTVTSAGATPSAGAIPRNPFAIGRRRWG